MTSAWLIFAGFCAIILAILVGIGYFLRATLSAVATVASIHAKTFAVAYVKSGSLMFIAASGAFATGYSALPPALQGSMPWAPYAVFFMMPMTAALSVLVAFLDRSAQRAGEEKTASSSTTAPFATTSPPLTKS